MGAANGEPSDELAQAALAQAAVVEEAALVEEQHAGLGVHDEPEGGFFEAEHRGLVLQDGKPLGLHALAEGGLAHGPGEFRPELAQLGQFGDAAGVAKALAADDQQEMEGGKGDCRFQPWLLAPAPVIAAAKAAARNASSFRRLRARGVSRKMVDSSWQVSSPRPTRS
jgi:hypothetical protein